MHNETPKTINELKILANVEGVNLSHLGFRIGLEAGGEGTTCIVWDDGTYRVYENMAGGERDMLYAGDDEAAAVATIYGRIVPVARKAGTPIGNHRRGSLFDDGHDYDDGSDGAEAWHADDEEDSDEIVEKVVLAIKVPKILLLGIPMLLMVALMWWLLGLLGI